MSTTAKKTARAKKQKIAEEFNALAGILTKKTIEKEKKQVNSLRYLQKHLSKLYQDGQIQIYK